MGSVISAAKFAGGSGAGLLAKSHDYARVAGTWSNGGVGFAGIKTAGGDLGWIRLIFTMDPNGGAPAYVTAIDWAYNNVAGQSITAGQTTAVPEPSAAALLALAGAGAAFLRRKRAA